MAKTDKKGTRYRGFREFYEEEQESRPKRKRVDESEKDKMKFRDKLKKLDPRALTQEDFDDDYFH